MSKSKNFLFVLPLLFIMAVTGISKTVPTKPESQKIEKKSAANRKNQNPGPPVVENSMLKALGAKKISAGLIKLAGITIDNNKKEIRFPAEINLRNGIIEVLVCTKRGRTHESLLITEIDPFKLQLALILAGAENGTRNLKDSKHKHGTIFKVMVQPESGKGEPIENWLFNSETKRKMNPVKWIFVGSSFRKNSCLATKEGNLINLNSMDRNTIIAPPDKPIYMQTIFTVNNKYLSSLLSRVGKTAESKVKVTVILKAQTTGQEK